MRFVLAMLAFILFAPAGAAAQGGAVERAGGWGRLHDPELGATFQFPAHIFTQRSAGDAARGTVFATPDGRATLRVFGFVNTRDQSPQRYLESIPEYRAETFHYVRTAPRFFVASGVRDGMILYRRCNFSPRADRRVACLQLEYPQTEKRAWDAVVTRMSRSLHSAL
jgi:hypothetical protein